MWRWRHLIWGGLLLGTMAVADVLGIDAKLLNEVRQTWGESGAARIVRWGEMADSLRDAQETVKLAKVNEFLNQIPFVSDLAHWHKEDYWATPVEMIASNGGDCEDFAIAKYFTLRALGVSGNRMRITYVKAVSLNQAHMVLTYYPDVDAEPLVLDNLINAILPASQRPDLIPVYSFNAEGLWVARSRGGGVRVGKGEDVDMWRDLLKRMQGMPGAPH